MEKVKNVGGYIRVSTTEQAIHGVSLESQESAIKALCEAKGYNLIDLYVDRGITARKKLQSRKEFCRMMEDVKSHRINLIIVLRLDRFFRNTYDYHRMMKEYLEPAGCDWTAVNEEYDTTTTNGRLMINLRLAIAEQECDIDSDRIKDVFRNRIQSGHVVTGRYALGYSITPDKRLKPNDDAVIVRDIYNDYIATGCVRKTMTDIRDKHDLVLNFKSFRQILSKEIYIGKYRNNPAFCEPIIDKNTFDTVQKMLENNTWFRPNTKYKEPYFFSGLLECPVCGNLLTGSRNKNGYKSYRCMRHYGDKTCSFNKYLSEPIIERYLCDNLASEWSNYNFHITEKAPDIKSTEKKKERLTGKVNRLNELYINGNISPEDYNRRYAEFASELDELDKTPKEMNQANRNLILKFREVYADFRPNEKNPFWRYIVERVKFNGTEISEIIFL